MITIIKTAVNRWDLDVYFGFQQAGLLGAPEDQCKVILQCLWGCYRGEFQLCQADMHNWQWISMLIYNLVQNLWAAMWKREHSHSLQGKWITTGTAYMALMITVLPMNETTAPSSYIPVLWFILLCDIRWSTPSIQNSFTLTPYSGVATYSGGWH